MRIITFLIFLFSINLSAQDLQVAEIFTDHAVLQHGKMLNIWGWSAPDATIFLKIRGERFRGKADSNGRWKIPTAKWPVGGPFEMSVTAGTEKLDFSDLYFGDVWLCSGQSNMEWTVKQSESEEAIGNYGTLPNIRHVKVEKSHAQLPDENLKAGSWEVASTLTIGDFTGVGFHFARNIVAHKNIPIGILHTSWGGSRIEAWMSEELLQKMGKEADIETAFKKQSYFDMMNENYALTDENQEENFWSKIDVVPTEWEDAQLPGHWENNGYEGMNGEVYYCKTITLTVNEAANANLLSLAKIDDADETYINGKFIGQTNQWDLDRRYAIPKNTLRAGDNLIAVKVTDNYGGGGFYGMAADMYLQIGETKMSLAGKWKMRLGDVHFSLEMQHQPAVLFNKMFYPLLDFPVRGVLWYQGESNAGGADAVEYAELFQNMIKDWRSLKNDPGLPFYWVQLANFMQETDDANKNSDWARLRTSQSSALVLPNTAEAVIIDAGEADDIHPKDKKIVGERLALAARAQVYGETDLVSENPRILTAKKTKSGDVVLTFLNKKSQLKNKDKTGEIRGFAVAGTDGIFHWAKAGLLEDNQVILACKAVDEPKQVRYLWSDNPGKIDLYNTENLPAAPFLIDVIGEE